VVLYLITSLNVVVSTSGIKHHRLVQQQIVKLKRFIKVCFSCLRLYWRNTLSCFWPGFEVRTFRMQSNIQATCVGNCDRRLFFSQEINMFNKESPPSSTWQCYLKFDNQDKLKTCTPFLSREHTLSLNASVQGFNYRIIPLGSQPNTCRSTDGREQ
jgi:hypothetical protein